MNLHSVNMDEEVDNMELSEERETEVDAKPGDSSALKDTEVEMEGKDEDDSAEGRNDVDSESGNKIDADSEKGMEQMDVCNVDSESGNKIDADSEKGMEQMDVCQVDKKSFSETASSTIDTENPEVETDEEEELQNWRKLFTSGSDEGEKILLDEYSSVLRNYKDVRKKPKEVDQKNWDGFYELASEIRELKNALSTRDEEIQLLRRKAGFIDENRDGNLTEFEASRTMTSPESALSDFLHISPEAADEGKGESIEKEAKETGGKRCLSRTRSFLTPDGKIRSGIDELLEENVAFWLRFCFCTSFRQIQKYQTSVQDLKSDVSALREKKKQEARSKRKREASRIGSAPHLCSFTRNKNRIDVVVGKQLSVERPSARSIFFLVQHRRRGIKDEQCK